MDTVAYGDKMAAMLFEFFDGIGKPEMSAVFLAYLTHSGYMLIERAAIETFMRERMNAMLDEMTHPVGNA